MKRGIWKDLESGFDAALARLPEALRAEGFGVITQIDLEETFKTKLGTDFRRYRILGACNPTLAHEAVQRDPTVGLLLPCNVVLYERDDGTAVLGAIDPIETIGTRAEFADLAGIVRDKLARVVAAVE
jgi:uncharacterized protein (DUF302 family)